MLPGFQFHSKTCFELDTRLKARNQENHIISSANIMETLIYAIVYVDTGYNVVDQYSTVHSRMRYFRNTFRVAKYFTVKPKEFKLKANN